MQSYFRALAPFAAAASLAFPALASADPLEDSLASTTCSTDQIVAGIQKQSPIAWAYISADPTRLADARAQLDSFLAQPPKARKAALQQQGDDHKTFLSTLKQQGPVVQQILDTCGQN